MVRSKKESKRLSERGHSSSESDHDETPYKELPEKDEEDDESSDDSDSVDDDDKIDPLDYIKNLCKLCKYIIKMHDKDNGIVRTSRRAPVLQKLINYEKTLYKDGVCFDNYIEEFFLMFKEHKTNILINDHIWLMENNVVVHHGKSRGKSHKYRVELCLSEIYNKAGEMYTKHINDKISEEGGKNTYSYLPLKMLKLIYLILMETTDNEKIVDKLSLILDSYDDKLGKDDGSYEEDYGMGAGLFGGNVKGGFEKILKLVFKSAKSHGIEIPSELEGGQISFSKISSALSTMFDNEKGLLSNIMSDISKCHDHNQLAELLMSRLKDPAILNKLSDAFGTELPIEKLEEALESNRDVIKTMLEGSYGDIIKEAASDSPDVSSMIESVSQFTSELKKEELVAIPVEPESLEPSLTEETETIVDI